MFCAAGRCWAWAVLMLALLCARVCCVVETYNSQSSAPFSTLLVDSFGLARDALIDIQYDVSVPTSQSANLSSYIVSNSYILLLLLSETETANGWYSSIGSSQASPASLCNQPSLFRQQLQLGSGSLQYNISSINAASAQYSVALLQCRELPQFYQSLPIALSATVTMKNRQPYSSGYTQLGIDQVNMMRVYGGEIIVYVGFILALLLQFHRTAQYIRGIHFFFLGTLVTQLLLVVSEYSVYRNFDQTGSNSAAYEYFSNIASHFNNVFTLATLLLLSLGWSMTRGRLSTKEIKLIVSALALYSFIGLAGAVCIESSSYQCQTLYLVTYIIRTLILLGIIVAMNFTVTQLKAMTMHSVWNPSLHLQYLMTRQYSFFRVCFIVYLLLPTVIFLVQNSLFTWEDGWMPLLLQEVLMIVLYFHMGVNFSPLHEVFVSRAFDGTYSSVHIE